MSSSTSAAQRAALFEVPPRSSEALPVTELRARDRQNPAGCLGSDRRLLRRGRPADARLHARARPEVGSPRRSRDARFAVDDSVFKDGEITSFTVQISIPSSPSYEASACPIHDNFCHLSERIDFEHACPCESICSKSAVMFG